MSLDQQLSLLASIAQIIQALVVIVGVPLVIMQVRGLRAEDQHRQWDALRWALDLLQQEAEAATLIFRERLDAKPDSYTYGDEAARDLLAHLSGSLTVVQVAIDRRYVDQGLLLTSIGPNLARLHRLIVSAQHSAGPAAGLSSAIVGFPGMRLLESARSWHGHMASQPASSASQVMSFGPDERRPSE